MNRELIAGLLFLCNVLHAQTRKDILLNENWRSIASNSDHKLNAGLFKINTDDTKWKKVNVPHNWDDYYGYRRLPHGNLHGEAWYRKTFSVSQPKTGKRFFLFFEGVGSYADVFLNGNKVGEHAGGRTTFTIDVTGAIKTDGSKNVLAVLARHPSFITDLPWVCGGCSDERGFSEGSQPLGIFRPVHLIVTSDVRIVPFGVHAWAEDVLVKGSETISIKTTLTNDSPVDRKIQLITQLVDRNKKVVMNLDNNFIIYGNDTVISAVQNQPVNNITLWSLNDPYLYSIHSIIKENGKEVDRVETPFGFREISWNAPSHQFLLNGKPVFINGIGEYEHLLGSSHAFSKEQVISRMNWVQQAGFNAFRDAHQPHNLLYGQLCDKMGILWWTQFSAHIWFDNPEFRKNFKQLLRDWVIERRNDPAVILWGLQNESKLPEDFAKECTQIIRELDPTASTQRLVTTCNGGSGTDWDVPQNWTGTYGGDPNTYAADLKKQILVGEYGAWRTLDLHTEGGFDQNGPLSEDRFCALLEKKINLAESVKDSVAGHFFWLLSSHDNPGRVQGGEGLRDIDRVGPVNYKGLLTPWEEPTDAFYLFRSRYVPASREPMVHIAGHNWPNRWMTPGIKEGIIVYSNCDEVELFNYPGNSLGKKKRNTDGHFQWDSVDIQNNNLFAIGLMGNIGMAFDVLDLSHSLEHSPDKLASEYKSPSNKNQPIDPGSPLATRNITLPMKGYNYIYRLNCGGSDYLDQNGNLWKADKGLYNKNKDKQYVYSSSWGDRFDDVKSNFASQRRNYKHIAGPKDKRIFETFRFGRDQLQFIFPLADGEYLLQLFFIEPWFNVLDAQTKNNNHRMFDIAVNGKTIIKDFEIATLTEFGEPLRKDIMVHVTGGQLIVSFPNVKVGEAVISAIAIASKKKGIQPAPSPSIFSSLDCKNCKEEAWLDQGDEVFQNNKNTFNSLPSNLYGADWLKFPKNATGNIAFSTVCNSDVFVVSDSLSIPADYEKTGTAVVTDENGGKSFSVYRRRITAGERLTLSKTKGMPMIALLPVTNMSPAFDLKPVITVREALSRSNGVMQTAMSNRNTEQVKTNDSVSVTYKMNTGVADIYSITLKYYFPGEQSINTNISVWDVNGKLMTSEDVNLVHTREGKWNTVTISTGTMINAGSYHVEMKTKNAEGLVLSGIDVQ